MFSCWEKSTVTAFVIDFTVDRAGFWFWSREVTCFAVDYVAVFECARKNSTRRRVTD